METWRRGDMNVDMDMDVVMEKAMPDIDIDMETWNRNGQGH
jgi:hypothetical protein